MANAEQRPDLIRGYRLDDLEIFPGFGNRHTYLQKNVNVRSCLLPGSRYHSTF